MDELAPDQLDERWLRGGFPRSFLAENIDASRASRESFIRTYLERDLPQLGINLPALTLRRFWTMLGHYHAQTWNGSELARALVLSDKTGSRYPGIAGQDDLLAHPKCGASWEGFALHEIIRHTGATRDEAYFWALHSGAELDLMTTHNGRRLGFEVKLTLSPKVPPSMRTAQEEQH